MIPRLPPPEPPPEFRCRRCGRCCRNEGQVRIGPHELDSAARALGMTPEAFAQRYTALSPNRDGLVLTGQPDAPCVFLQPNHHCRIQQAKPWQCRAFPRSWRFPGYERLCRGMQAQLT